MSDSLGSRITSARKAVGLTQEKLALALGIALSTLNKYEKGHRVPDATLLNRMAKLLHCDPGWLLSGEVREGPEPAAEVPPSIALLKEVVQTVEDIFQEKGLGLPSDKKAELVALLYEELLNEETRKTDLRGRVIKLTRLAS